MRATWAAGALTAVLLATGSAGCGSPTSGAADGPTTTPGGTTSPTDGSGPADAPPTEEGCPYLDADQVTAALGVPMSETAGTVNACFFDPQGGDGPSVLLSRVDIQIDPAEYAHQSKVLCQGEVTDVDAGDEAFACVMGMGPQGQLYNGRVLVTVAVDDAADDAAGIAAAAALLREVTIPPSAG